MKRFLSLILTLALALLCACGGTKTPSGSATADTVATPDTAATQRPTVKQDRKKQAEASDPKASETPAEPEKEPVTEDYRTELRAEEILGNPLSSTSVILPLEELSQYPELPTGCEVTSLTMALNTLGCKVSKTEFAENYLEYNDSYVIGFCGDPFADDGAGTFPPGIAVSVQNYAAATGEKVSVYDSSGLSLNYLYRFIDAGCPVLVWTTYYMDEPMETDDGEFYNGKYYMWYDNEHCVTLYGYDTEAGTVEIADPIEGLMTVDAASFEEINRSIGGWSAVILRLPE